MIARIPLAQLPYWLGDEDPAVLTDPTADEIRAAARLDLDEDTG